MKSMFIAVLIWGVVCVGPLSAQQPAKQPAKPSAKTKAELQRVIASVGEHKITQAEVDLALGRTASGRNDLPPVPEPILMASVEIVAQRRQALESLKRAGKRVSDSAIDKWLVENSPPELKLSATQALTARAEAAGVAPASYRDFLAFRLSWQEYLQTALTEKNIEKHFLNQKSRFDGTRYEVQHVAMPTVPGKSSSRTEAHKQLGELRLKVVANQMTMVEAALSLLAGDVDAKTKQLVGQEVGPMWITGNGPLMPKIFDVVLKTPEGKISEPFDSSTAVHIVRVIKIQPGSRPLSEVQDDVRKHMLVFLLDFHASKFADEMPLVWLAK